MKRKIRGPKGLRFVLTW